MPDPDDHATSRAADDPTRLQRVARRGCAGLAYAIVLVPVVLEVARTMLEAHEIQGGFSSQLGLDARSPAAAAMDRHNNEIAIRFGRTARTWEDARLAAREVMDNSDRSSDGPDGGAVWLPESEWKSHPVDTETGREKSPEEWNWPATNREDDTVDSDPTYRYPYGGEEHRHEPAIDDELPLNLEDAAHMSPLSRPVASWSADDLRRVMAAPAYCQPNHPGRARAHALVREWFERAEIIGAARVDASGRPAGVSAAASAPAGGVGEVPVRPHSRDGGKVEVGAHCRARPAA